MTISSINFTAFEKQLPSFNSVKQLLSSTTTKTIDIWQKTAPLFASFLGLMGTNVGVCITLGLISIAAIKYGETKKHPAFQKIGLIGAITTALLAIQTSSINPWVTSTMV